MALMADLFESWADKLSGSASTISLCEGEAEILHFNIIVTEQGRIAPGLGNNADLCTRECHITL